MMTIAISESDYSRLEDAGKTLASIERDIERLAAQRDEYKSAYEKQVDLALKKSIAFENMSKREQSLAVMLGQACDEIEGIFNTTGELASVEIAAEYTVWAKFLERYGRKEHFAGAVQEWIDKQ